VTRAAVYSVLLTALPSSLLAEALTNSKAVSLELASEFSEGITPTWFTALPTPVQSYLLQQGASSNATGLVNSTIPHNTTLARTTATLTHNHHTTRITGVVHTGGHTTKPQAAASSSSAAASSSSSSSTGGASMPTNIIGAGLAGAVGLVGLLAL
jgi:hypothetical protein